MKRMRKHLKHTVEVVKTTVAHHKFVMQRTGCEGAILKHYL
jgi:hypothetical protein